MSKSDSQQEALNRIKSAIKNKNSELDLSRMDLTAIPSEIGQLSGLQQLYLFNNQLTSLPKEIGQLSNQQMR